MMVACLTYTMPQEVNGRKDLFSFRSTSVKRRRERDQLFGRRLCHAHAGQGWYLRQGPIGFGDEGADRQRDGRQMSRISLFDGLPVTEFDALPASASGLL
jgi:hypothetical protein